MLQNDVRHNMDVREDPPQSVDESFPGSVDPARPDQPAAQLVPSASARVATAQEMPTLSQNAPGVVVTLANLLPDVDLSNFISAAVTGLDIQYPGTETVDMATPYVVGMAASSTGVAVPVPSEHPVLHSTPTTNDVADTPGLEGSSQQTAQVVQEK